MFRKVFKRDRKGNLLDAAGNIVSRDDPDKFRKAVHLNDIHLEKGMHCVDCHFRQDAHGDGISTTNRARRLRSDASIVMVPFGNAQHS